MEAQLFKIILLIAALPAAYIVHRVIKNNKDSFSGRVWNILKFEFSGPLATYTMLTLFYFVTFTPSSIGLRLNNEKSNWDFQINYDRYDIIYENGSRVKKKHHTGHSHGEIDFKKGTGSLITISGTHRGLSTPISEAKWDGKGFQTNDYIYFPFKIPEIGNKLVAHGSIISNDKLELQLTSLYRGEVTENSLQGVVLLHKKYPWTNLIIFIFAPIGIVLGLWKIAPLVGNLISINQSREDISGQFKFQLTSGSAAYGVILILCYVAFHEAPPKILSDKTYQKQLERIQGTYYFNLYHTNNPSVVEYTGRIKVNLDANKKLKAKGRMTFLHLAKAEKYDSYNSYRKSPERIRNDHLNRTTVEYNWNSVAMGLIEEQLIIVYRFSNATNQNDGFLFSPLFDAEDEQKSWTYFDVPDWRAQEGFINSGSLKVFKKLPENIEEVSFDLIQQFHQMWP